MIKYTKNCRVCGHNDLKEILNLGNQSIQGALIYPNKTKPSIREIPLSIKICNTSNGGCGLVQNYISIDPSILYFNYGYRSSISNTMKNHLNDIVKESILLLNKGEDIFSPSVLDIGCNDGYMLKQYPKHFNRYGIDPSDIANEITDENINIINACFPSSQLLLENNFDIISSIACFYDIDNPIEFCKNIEKGLEYDGIWVVEFAYLPSVLNNLAYDGMVHEHLCLYSLYTFENILNRTGLKIFKAEENDTNGGSLKCWITKNNNNKFDNKNDKENILKIKIKEFDMQLDNINSYKIFIAKVWKHREELLKILNSLKEQNKKIHIYGMSTKLNTILQFCDINTDLIDCAAERSKEKWGAKTISGIPIVSEEESRKTVDVYLVGPYHFKKEILEREEELIKKGVQFLFPLPKIELL